MRSADDDLTARAAIREAALELFAADGPDAVSIRRIASDAGVSPALVLHHYGSKQGLRQAVDEHVVTLVDRMVDGIDDDETAHAAVDPEDATARELRSRAREVFHPGSPVVRYVTRMLVSGDDSGKALFRDWYRTTSDHLDRWERAGFVRSAASPDVRAAMILAHKLSALVLRDQIIDAAGLDPLSPDGLAVWNREGAALYSGGLWTTTTLEEER